MRWYLIKVTSCFRRWNETFSICMHEHSADRNVRACMFRYCCSTYRGSDLKRPKAKMVFRRVHFCNRWPLLERIAYCCLRSFVTRRFQLLVK